MFGTPRRIPRPFLLIIVFGVFLIVVGVTAMAQIVLVSAHFSTSTLNSVVGDRRCARPDARHEHASSPDDLTPAGPSAHRLATLEGRLTTLTSTGEILQIEVRRPDGQVIASSEPARARRHRPR